MKQAVVTTLVGVSVLAAADTAAAAPPDRVQGGNGVYTVTIRGEDPVGRTGQYGVYTGPDHPITAELGWFGDIIHVERDCFTCADGFSEFTGTAVRSYSSRTTYTLGSNPLAHGETSPGYTCYNASEIAPPLLEPIIEGGETIGARATWEISGADDLRAEVELVAHGRDFVDSAAEVTARVTNLGSESVEIGVRDVFLIGISNAPTERVLGVGKAFIGTRPPDPPLEPFATTESEWVLPDFRAWDGAARENPSIDPPFLYHLGGAIGGPETLPRAPTPPDLLQTAEARFSLSGADGAAAHCFDWRTPEPPRHILAISEMTATSYWGYPEERAITLAPGDSVQVTQYLMAYFDYPLAVDAGGPYEEECQGAVTAVPLEPLVELTHDTVAEPRHRWSSEDPAVSFTDPTTAAPEALLPGAGTYPVTLTVSVGPYEAAATAEVTVTDADPPRFTALSVGPEELWPPNHRLVEVNVAASVEDECDPAPVVRLVSVESNEPVLREDFQPGAGRHGPDVQEADLGTDDRSVLLRAERGGRLEGRLYTLTYEAEDAAGNVARESVVVRVGHDRRGALDPAPRDPPRRTR